MRSPSRSAATTPDLVPAIAVTLAAVTVGLAGDVWLHRQGHRHVTDVLRTPAALLAQAYLGAHVVDVLGPIDLFKIAGRLIPQKGTPT